MICRLSSRCKGNSDGFSVHRNDHHADLRSSSLLGACQDYTMNFRLLSRRLISITHLAPLPGPASSVTCSIPRRRSFLTVHSIYPFWIIPRFRFVRNCISTSYSTYLPASSIRTPTFSMPCGASVESEEVALLPTVAFTTSSGSHLD